MLCPANGLVGQNATDRTRISNGAVGRLKFVRVGVYHPISGLVVSLASSSA